MQRFHLELSLFHFFLFFLSFNAQCNCVCDAPPKVLNADYQCCVPFSGVLISGNYSFGRLFIACLCRARRFKSVVTHTYTIDRRRSVHIGDCTYLLMGISVCLFICYIYILNSIVNIALRQHHSHTHILEERKKVPFHH